MAFSRNSVAAAVAGTLSLAALTGCPAPTTTQPSASPSAGATAAPTTAPTSGATTAPTTAPTDGTTPTAAPSVTPSASTLQPTTVQGRVFDENNALVNTGAQVVIKSLNPSNPFETTVDVVNGNYVANQVPAGVLVEVTARRAGWASRTQVVTPLPLSSQTQGGNQVDFGGGTNPYFITQYPEISSVEPAHDANLADNSKLTYKLTLSEPLDAVNRARVAAALRVFPLNAEANNGTASGIVDGGGAAVTGDAIYNYDGNVEGTAQYWIREGFSFLTNDNLATVTWDAAGQVATLTFNAPLLTDDNERALYGVALVRTAANSDRIVDADGNQLGTSTTAGGSLSTYPATAGLVIPNTFRLPNLGTVTDGATGATRLAAVRANAVRFGVPVDDTDPTLTAFSVVGRNTFTLTFSEPMAAFRFPTNSTPSTVAPFNTFTAVGTNNTATGNYRFRFGQSESNLGTNDDINTSGATVALSADQLPNAVQGTTYTLGTGFNITVSETDTRIVRIRPIDTTFQLNPRLTHARVRVTGVADTAGNVISTTGDANIRSTTL